MCELRSSSGPINSALTVAEAHRLGTITNCVVGSLRFGDNFFAHHMLVSFWSLRLNSVGNSLASSFSNYLFSKNAFDAFPLPAFHLLIDDFMISGFRRGVNNLILSIILPELEQELRRSSVKSFMIDPCVKTSSCVQRAL
jgi:hypothetical protein